MAKLIQIVCSYDSEDLQNVIVVKSLYYTSHYIRKIWWHQKFIKPNFPLSQINYNFLYIFVHFGFLEDFDIDDFYC